MMERMGNDQVTNTHLLQQLPESLTLEAHQEQKRFLDAYFQRVKRVLALVSLTVLVWGPSPTLNTPTAEKRKQIRQAIRMNGHNALFSEEIDSSLLTEDGLEMPLSILETAQALEAHFIVVLVDKESKGVIAELDICARDDVAAKVFVLVPTIFKEGFIQKDALTLIEGGNGAVYWYFDEEIDSCKVLKMAVWRVEQKRFTLLKKLL